MSSADGARPPLASPGLLMWRVTLAWQRRIAAALRPLDLTHVQFVLATATWWLNDVARERPTQRALAEFAGLDAMMTSQVLRALESKGLVTRDRAEHDARARAVVITEAGRRLALRAVDAVEEVDRAFFGAAGMPETVRLLEALDRQERGAGGAG